MADEQPPRRRPGRPRVPDDRRKASVSIYLPIAVIDNACRLAMKHDVSTARVLERAVLAGLRREEDR